MSLLIPVLGKARESAYRVQCSSNLRQIGLAIRQYADSANGTIPYATNLGLWEKPVGTGISPTANSAYWGVLYLPMLTKVSPSPSKNTEVYQKTARSIFRCPSSVKMDPDNGYYNPDQPASYGFNYNACTFASNLKWSTWNNPAELILVQDSVEHRMEGNGDSLSTWDVPVNNNSVNLAQWRLGTTSTSTEYFPEAIYEYYRHNKYCNTLWMDGHVSGILMSDGKDVPRRWYTGK